MGAAEVIVLVGVEEWFLDLAKHDGRTAQQVIAAIDLLKDQGFTLGRPVADRIKGSRLHHLKELRPPGTTVRILFAFDPSRNAVPVVAGDKTGQWKTWYTRNIPLAESRYAAWLEEQADVDR